MKLIDIPASTLALALNGHQEDWPSPIPLAVPLAAVPPFDPELLPDPLRSYVMDAAERLQCAPDGIAVSMVATLGSIIGTGCAVRPKKLDNWTITPNLWGGVVGGPSTKKSPAIEAGTKPIYWLNSKAHGEWATAKSHYLAEQLDREMEIKKLKGCKNPKDLGLDEESLRERLKHLTRAQQQAKEPPLPRYHTNDATIEKIAELLVDNTRGLLYLRDELNGLLKSCDKPGHEGDRAFLLEAWNGQHAYATDRIGRGSIVVPRLNLSIVGTIQPDRLMEYLMDTLYGGQNDGLLQRFQLLVYPDTLSKFIYVDRTPDPDSERALKHLVLSLADTDFLSLGAERDHPESIPYFRFSDSAQPIFIKWLTRLETELLIIESSLMVEHLAKFRKLIPALALIFHLIDLATGRKPRQTGISKQALQRALAWEPYLRAHAQRIYGLTSHGGHPAVQALAKKLQEGRLQDGFSERDVYKADWANLTNPETVRYACRELEQDHWIKRIPSEAAIGRPPSPTYRINPAVKERGR